MSLYCPWTGLKCDCKEFPWKVNDHIPKHCLKIQPNGQPDSDLREDLKIRYAKTLIYYGRNIP